MFKVTIGSTGESREASIWKTDVSDGQCCWPRGCRHKPLIGYWQTWKKGLWRAIISKDEQRRVTQQRKSQWGIYRKQWQREEVEKWSLQKCSCLFLWTHWDLDICIVFVWWLLLCLKKTPLSSINQTTYLVSMYLIEAEVLQRCIGAPLLNLVFETEFW